MFVTCWRRHKRYVLGWVDHARVGGAAPPRVFLVGLPGFSSGGTRGRVDCRFPSWVLMISSSGDNGTSSLVYFYGSFFPGVGHRRLPVSLDPFGRWLMDPGRFFLVCRGSRVR